MHFCAYRASLHETPQKRYGIVPGTPKTNRDDALVHFPSGTEASPKSTPTSKKHTCDVPPSGDSGASSAARSNYSEDDNELFSTEYVDKLVASFWNKVDKKIETAVSQHHSSPQAGQQCNTDDNGQAKTSEAEDKQNGKINKQTIKVKGQSFPYFTEANLKVIPTSQFILQVYFILMTFMFLGVIFLYSFIHSSMYYFVDSLI